MATYKVLQDIEAEDKLVGPLTLRQCIYAAIALLAGWLSYVVASHGAPYVAIIFLPFIIFGAFFAIPWSKQQSTEVWALAKIRFALKPRRRIWDQTGTKHLVTVTAPKKHDDGPQIRDISETEVRSRLKALADTIDSRGWAVKNVPLDMFARPAAFGQQSSSDRLIDAGNLVPPQVPDTATTPSDDMFDYANNPLAQQFNDKINASTNAYRQHIMDVMHHQTDPVSTAPAPAAQQGMGGAAVQPTNWYLPEGAGGSNALTGSATSAASANAASSSPAFSDAAQPMNASWGIPEAANPTPEEVALAQEIKHKQEIMNSVQATSHIRTIQPLSVQMAQAAQQSTQSPQTSSVSASDDMQQQGIDNAQAPMTDQRNPAILGLANNNDLDVATIAREAQELNDASGEVVVKLH